jgi:mannose-6-phosphate isomerase-like protein (cupin superfamily)
MPPTVPIIISAGDGEKLACGPTTTTVLISGQSCGIGIVELEFPQSFDGPPLHIHDRVDHVWYVVSGTVDVEIGDRVALLGPGSAAFVPAGTAHKLSVHRGPARILEIDTRGGLDAYYRELAREFPADRDVEAQAIATIQNRHATRAARH